ncbi:MAG TPA: ribonuclease P protein component [Syntrophaceae bacterium]|nr:ribonuclease P protein component [Syntrophaceae bacterium]
MKQFSLNKTERIRKRSEFLSIARFGKRYHTKHFMVVFNPNHLGIARLGISVSKKVGGPVKRNRVKRLIREFFRLNKRNLPCSHDVLVVAKQGSSNLTYQEVYSELRRFFVN